MVSGGAIGRAVYFIVTVTNVLRALSIRSDLGVEEEELEEADREEVELERKYAAREHGELSQSPPVLGAVSVPSPPVARLPIAIEPRPAPDKASAPSMHKGSEADIQENEASRRPPSLAQINISVNDTGAGHSIGITSLDTSDKNVGRRIKASATGRRALLKMIDFVRGMCPEARDGSGRLGCNVGCGCSWGERCYPKPRRNGKVGATPNPREGQVREGDADVDVGICGTSFAMMALESAALISFVTGCMVITRLCLQQSTRPETEEEAKERRERVERRVLEELNLDLTLSKVGASCKGAPDACNACPTKADAPATNVSPTGHAGDANTTNDNNPAPAVTPA